MGEDDTCSDSGVPISYLGRDITCNIISRRNKCDRPVAASHCPETCGMCEMYGCADSDAPFEYDGGTEFCSSIPDSACDTPSIASTCRETCNFCFDGNTCASTISIKRWKRWFVYY